MWRKKGNLKKALADFRKSAAREPCKTHGGDALYQAGYIWFLREDFDKAIECSPDMAEAYFNQGMVRCSKARESNNLIKAILTQKATDEAGRVVLLAQLERIGGKDFVPQADADVLMAKSAGLFAEDDALEAIEDLSRSIALEPDHAEAYYQRGLAYTLLGEADKALSDYEQTCVLDPDHVKAAGKRDELLESRKQATMKNTGET